MKDSDEYQRAECDHAGHTVFTAPRITDIHFFSHHSPKLIVTVESKTCLYSKRDAKETRSHKIIISARDLILHCVLKHHSAHSK